MSGREDFIPFVKRPAILALKWYTDKSWEEISANLGVHPESARDIVKQAKKYAQEPTRFESVLECGPLADGVYRVRNAQEFSHYLSMMDHNVVATDGSEALWKIRFSRGTGDYSIINVNLGLWLEQETEETKLSTGPSRNSAGQRWKIKCLGSGYFQVTNVKNAGLAIALEDSESRYTIPVVCIQQADDERQQWEFESSS